MIINNKNEKKLINPLKYENIKNDNKSINNTMSKNLKNDKNDKPSHCGRFIFNSNYGIKNGGIIVGVSNGKDIKSNKIPDYNRLYNEKFNKNESIDNYIQKISPRYSQLTSKSLNIDSKSPIKYENNIGIDIDESNYTPHSYLKPIERLPKRIVVRTLISESITDSDGLIESFEKVMDIDGNPLWEEVKERFNEILEEENKHGVGEENTDLVKMVIDVYDIIVSLFPNTLTDVLSETLEYIVNSTIIKTSEGIEELSIKYANYLENELHRLNDEWSLWMSREYRLNNTLNTTNREVERLTNEKNDLELDIENTEERIHLLEESNIKLISLRSSNIDDLEGVEKTRNNLHKETRALELHNAATIAHQSALDREYELAEAEKAEMKRRLECEIVPQVAYDELLNQIEELKNTLAKMDTKYKEGIKIIETMNENRKNMEKEYDRLIKERKNLLERRGCTTPRPEWEEVKPILDYNDECKLYCESKKYDDNSTLSLSYTLCNNIHEVRITGGMAAKLTKIKHELEMKRIESERLRNEVTLNKIKEINISKDDPEISYFKGMGNGNDVPKYLKHKGNV